MANFVISATLISDGHGLTLPTTSDSAYVMAGVTLGSGAGGGAGILGMASGQRVTVAGNVFGSEGLRFRANAANVIVMSGGTVATTGTGVGFDATNNIINNAGTISAYNALFSITGSMNVINSGQVQALSDAITCNGALMLTNTGMIDASRVAIIAEGAANIQNLGTIVGHVWLHQFADVVINTGSITGDVLLGDGADRLDTNGGRILGRIDLGGGADVFTGSGFGETVEGGLGRDDISLGAGDDLFAAENDDGSDDIDGGAGIDTYDGSLSFQAMTVNLATGQARIGNMIDDITGFERVFGGGARDALTGDSLNNTLRGGGGNDVLVAGLGQDKVHGDAGADTMTGDDGNDRLFGGDGRDSLSGGTGNDVLQGGFDADVLTGGPGADRFVWDDLSDFTLTATPTDRITDFVRGEDKIDLSGIDAQPGGDDDAFVFVRVETDFNQVSVSVSGIATIVSINFTDVIRLDGVTGITADDFIL